MALLDRFRAKPEWQDPDPRVRLAAVQRFAGDAIVLGAIVREDGDPAVRRAALRRIDDLATVAHVARTDSSEDVRSDACSRLIAAALEARDEAAAEAALSALSDPRHLVTVAKEAKTELPARAAIARILDARSLALIARTATLPSIRVAAVEKVADPELLTEIAQRTEHKDAALAALEKIKEPRRIEAVASSAKNRTVMKRAQMRIESAAPVEAVTILPPPVAPPEPPETESGFDRAEELRQRERLCLRIETLAGELALSRLAEARAEWDRQPALEGADAEALAARVVRACDQALVRTEAEVALRRQHEDLCRDAEALASVPDLAAAARALADIQFKWATIRPGDQPAPPALQARFDATVAVEKDREAAARESRLREASENLTRLQSLCDGLEAFLSSGSTSLKDVDHWVKEIRASLDAPGPLPSRRDSEHIQGRLEAGRKQLHARLLELRQDEDWRRWANLSVQEELCGRGEALLQMENLDEVARELREIEARWQEVRQVPKGEGQPLWERFSIARQTLHARCSEHFAARAALLKENSEKKESLCQQAEALADSTDWIGASDALKALQEEWKKIGPTARQDSKLLWERFRKACDTFFLRRNEDRKRRSSEHAANLARKQALCEQAEKLSDATDWEKTAQELKRLQAEWKTVGPVRKNHSEAVWQRFRAACDHFFQRYQRRDDIAFEELLSKAEALCVQFESMLPAGPEIPVTPPENLAERLREASAAWRQLSPQLPRERAEELDRRLLTARARLFEVFSKAFEGTEYDLDATRKKLEKVLSRVEGLLLEFEPRGESASMADRLRNALAANALGGRATVVARWNTARLDVESAQAAWSRLTQGPVDTPRVLAERFNKACRRFFELRPGADRA